MAKLKKARVKKIICPTCNGNGFVTVKNDFIDGNNNLYKFIDDKFYFCGECKPIPSEWFGDHHIEHMDN